MLWLAKRDVTTVRTALRIAIDSDEAMIDAYRIKLVRRKGVWIYVIPEDAKKYTDSVGRRIERMQRVLNKLK